MIKKSATKPTSDTPVALLTADLHLQACAWADRRRVHGDAYWAFRQLVATARKYDVPIIAAGDVLDAKRHDTATPAELQRLFGLLKDVEFYYIQGDHDRLDTPWLSVLLPQQLAVKYLPAEAVCTINGVRFQGFDWQNADELPQALSRVSSAADVVVMHQTLEELTGGLYQGEMTAAQVPHAQMLLIGDIHASKTLRCTGASGQPLLVVSPGSPCKQSIDESDDKSAYLLCRAADGTLTPKRVPLRQRATLRYTVYDDDDVERIVNAIDADIVKACASAPPGMPEHMAQYPLVAVEVDRRQATNWRRIVRAVGTKAELFRLWRETAAAADGVQETVVVDDAACLDVVAGGMPAAIRQYVPDAADRDLLLRLWQADNPAKELQALTTLTDT